MTQLHPAILVIGGSVLVLGLFSKRLNQWGVPDPLILLLLGIALGPKGLAVLTPATWGDQMAILEYVAQLTLAIGLMGVALRLPNTYTRDRWKDILILLLLSMPFMWLCSSLLAGAFLGLPMWVALLIGAIVTPTDPVVASSIVTGAVAESKLPERLRHILSAESGFNDGFAIAFVLLPALMLTNASGEALSQWLVKVLLLEIVGAIVMGIVAGYVVGRMLQFAEARDAIEEPSILATTTALALTTISLVTLIGSNGILAVFFAGVAFDQVVSTGERQREKRVVEGIDRFFILPIFTFLGLIIPWQEWLDLGWSGMGLAGAILLFRRLPLFLTLGGRWQDMPRLADRAFAGWFGPIGVAALYYGALASQRVHVEAAWPVVSLVVCASIAVHGITATPFARLYAAVVQRAE